MRGKANLRDSSESLALSPPPNGASACMKVVYGIVKSVGVVGSHPRQSFLCEWTKKKSAENSVRQQAEKTKTSNDQICVHRKRNEERKN